MLTKRSVDDDLLVLAKNSTGQCVWSGSVQKLQRFIDLLIVINVGCDNWAKYFLSHDLVVRILRFDERRFNEIASSEI